MSDKVALGLLSTGVPGLDVLLQGGLPEFSFNLVAGPPGSGKTTLAHQIMFSLATPERRALFFTVLGEPPLKMLRYQQQFSFFDVAKVGPAIRYVNLGETLRQGDFSGVLERIMAEVEDFSPSLVFVDSFRSVVQTAKGGNEGLADLQYFIQELGTRMTTWQATTFLIGEYMHADPEANPIMTVADGMFSLTQAHEHSTVVRKMRVVKMRGHPHLAGSHNFRITGDGLRVYPRVLPPLADDRHPGHPVDRDPRRIATGTAGLDGLLHGGLPQGHSMLVVGPTGAGKTILGTKFLKEGARRGEKGVAMFFEKGTARLRNPELAEMVQEGSVAVVESRMLDLTVDELIDELQGDPAADRSDPAGDRLAFRICLVHGAGIPRRPAPGRVPAAGGGRQARREHTGHDRPRRHVFRAALQPGEYFLPDRCGAGAALCRSGRQPAQVHVRGQGARQQP